MKGRVRGDRNVKSKSRPLTIPCVDDEAGALLIRSEILEHAGYVVLTAKDAPEALVLFNARTVDLVVADERPGVSASELVAQIKSIRPGTPVLLLCGSWSERGDKRQADKLLKRVEGPEKLLNAMADLLRYRRSFINEGEYDALIACDTHLTPHVWHYVIQHGPTEIVTWSQERTEKAAIAAAKEQLSALNRQKKKQSAV
jgi:CheY-like chemotaxis protein